MNIKLSRALCATTALATGLLLSGQALAQSSGTAIVEELVVTGSTGPKNLDGVIVAEREPKARATITQELITRGAPGQTILDSINLLPSVNFTNNDPYGSAGGDITIRGFDSQRVALLQDGVPLNDSGNYAIYPNQQLDSDLIEKATVNLGTTDVDSPTAAAAGGTINYTTRRASDEFGIRAELAAGSDDFQRYYGTIESGAIGPFGTKIWVSGLYTRNDLFKPRGSSTEPKGKIQKKQFNARIDQDFGDVGQASLIFNYNENRNNFINRLSLATFNRGGVTAAGLPESLVSPTTCVRPTPAGGTAQVDNSAGFGCPTGYYDFNINPSNTGNIRGLSSWNLGDQLTLTVDPSFQYTLANGGGVQLMSERDAQIRGNTAAVGLDLNGDGDTLDSVYLYRPNTTNTRRYSVTSSLIWKFADNQSVRAAYTFDRAKHRQTGDFGYVGQDGTPENPFAGKDGEGRAVVLPDGTNLRRRDRYSVAMLNQVSVEYRGRFMEDKLLVNVGVRAPFFKRDLNNYCYQQNTFNALCTTTTPTPVAGTNDGTGKPLVTFPQSALNSSAALRYGNPRSFTRKYDDVLPNLGASYNFTDALSVYASYAETISVPRTDDLYDQVLVDPKPETSNSYDLGVRYQAGGLLVSAGIYQTDFKNRIERVLDEPSGVAFSQNVGDVRNKGFDAQIGFKPTDNLSVYASYSYISAKFRDDIPNAVAGILPTKGNQTYDQPKNMGSVRVQWEPIEMLSLGVQGKFTGDRYTNLVNTEKFNGYTLWDLDARVKLDQFGLKNTYLQGNIRNLFNERYLGDMTPNLTGTALGQPGYNRTFILTLHVEY
ncbi:MAG: TonB-dependent receptor [Alphaproteobacteria bacterium]|nr:TonB-dependent receptor [Alphaproteobacteria bacterium]MBU1517013.1 TonB-dependent receptor [Alphaproteobacteria bacterium]MBU2093632.1 TonB-dependent receptor [Alphaproteobacteria bacterium]MBU2152522.1 TonB-dependent receptor [Alphaproteobacteria bacterium]MBU2308768.1 TonB-dependent receptor [Alphaproteobacteria bacterium]